MKKILISILLMCLQSAYAIGVEINKKVVCDTTKAITEILVKEYKEVPVWSGTEDHNKFSLLVNNDTGTWTIVQFNNDTACILGTGENSRMFGFMKKTPML